MKTSQQVQQLESDNERLQHQNRDLRAMLVRMIAKHGNEISTEPLMPQQSAQIGEGDFFLRGNHILVVLPDTVDKKYWDESDRLIAELELADRERREIAKKPLIENPENP